MNIAQFIEPFFDRIVALGILIAPIFGGGVFLKEVIELFMKLHSFGQFLGGLLGHLAVDTVEAVHEIVGIAFMGFDPGPAIGGQTFDFFGKLGVPQCREQLQVRKMNFVAEKIAFDRPAGRFIGFQCDELDDGVVARRRIFVKHSANVVVREMASFVDRLEDPLLPGEIGTAGEQFGDLQIDIAVPKGLADAGGRLAKGQALAHDPLGYAETSCDFLNAETETLQLGEGFEVVDRTERLSNDVFRQGFFGCIGVIVRHDTAGELLGFGEVSVLCQLTEGCKAPAAIADLIFPGIGLGETDTEVLQEAAGADRRDHEVVRRLCPALARVVTGHDEFGQGKMHDLPGLGLGGHEPVSLGSSG